MNIKNVTVSGDGVLIDGTYLPNNSVGHVRDSYDSWLAKGNKPRPEVELIDSESAKIEIEITWKNSELLKTDVSVLRAYEEGLPVNELIVIYRTKLRGYKGTKSFPNGKRPTL